MTTTLADAAVCLLLVSAAAVVVSETHRPPHPDEPATTVTTVTERVTYPVGAGHTRTRHGTLAELLAVAAVADAVKDRPLVRAVRAAVRATLGRGVQVVARWRFSPDAPIAGRVTVGPEPSTDTVHATSFVVPVGTAGDDTPAVRELLRVTLPPSRRAIGPGGIDDRYRTLATAYGTDPSIESVPAAIDRLRAAIDVHERATPGRVQIVVRRWES